MRITYDPYGDVLYIEFNKNPEGFTDFDKVEGLGITYDTSGKVSAIEILDATEFVSAPNHVDFECYFYKDPEEPLSEQKPALDSTGT
jgi:uncharacterized protein YuzE